MIRTLSLSVLLLAGTPALLAAQKGNDPCPDARTQTEMTTCAGEHYRSADRILNERWQRLLRAMEDEPERVALLREAQRAWIRFRDTQCDFEASAFEGGSMMPMVGSFCMAELTRTRAEQLSELIRAATEP